MSNVKKIINLMMRKVSQEESELIEEAYKFAENAHQSQKRLSGEPYFFHPFETAKILAGLGMDVQTVVGGLLHDILKNTKITEKELEEKFGSEILSLVKNVTSLGKLRYHGHERYVESLRKLFIAMSNDLRAVVIKFADRLHNLRTLKHMPEEKRHRIAVESIEVYAPIANRLGMGKLKGEIEDAAFPFAFPKEHAHVEEILKEKEELYQKYLIGIHKKLGKELKKNKIKVAKIDYRIKRKYSLWKKLFKHEIENIYDIMALCVVVDSVEDCYKVLGVVNSIWNPVFDRIKDYINFPKSNGYQSIHVTISVNTNETAEIQIRTKKMHAEAIFGMAAHFAYKEQTERKKYDNKLKFRWLKELSGLNPKPEESKELIQNFKNNFFNDRIFVFTPEGDVVDLPEDSSPIDFAYFVHTDLGNHLAGVKINGKMSTIFSKLKSKDIVEIIEKQDHHPSNKWLDHVKTNMAKKHVKSYLEKDNLLKNNNIKH
jgi:GTP diphosphokinase / guanosine-3',5'-bis(diphosphate) 3'-diphosphatase